MNKFKSIEDELAWTKWNLEMANAEVKKGVQMTVKLERALDDIRRLAYKKDQMVYEIADKALDELNEFRYSYID